MYYQSMIKKYMPLMGEVRVEESDKIYTKKDLLIQTNLAKGVTAQQFAPYLINIKAGGKEEEGEFVGLFQQKDIIPFLTKKKGIDKFPPGIVENSKGPRKIDPSTVSKAFVSREVEDKKRGKYNECKIEFPHEEDIISITYQQGRQKYDENTGLWNKASKYSRRPVYLKKSDIFGVLSTEDK